MMTTAKPVRTVGSHKLYPFARMFLTEIDGNVNGIINDMYLRITGIPSRGQNIPKIEERLT